MCGIFGVGLQDGCSIDTKTVRNLVEALILESKKDGNSTGVMFARKDNITVLRDNIPAENFVSLRTFKKTCRRRIFVNTLHGRDFRTLSVTGSCIHTPTIEYNGHPTVTNNIVGVHSGVITNDDDLFDRYQFFLKRKGEISGEIIFQLIDYFVHAKKLEMTEAIKKTESLLKGSFACAFVDRTKPSVLWLFRDTTPLSILNYEDCGIIIYASVVAHVYDAVRKICGKRLGAPEEVHLFTHHCIGIDLVTNSIQEFKLYANQNYNYM